MRRLILFVIILLLTTALYPALTQEGECPAFIATALDLAHETCDGTETNFACYGHASLEAELFSTANSVAFEQAGDMVELSDLRSLRLSALDTGNQLWGVSLMRVAAVPQLNQPLEPLTLLFFGDVSVENRVAVPVEFPVTVAGRRNVNIRFAPNGDAVVLGTLSSGATALAQGRLADNSWIYIKQEATGLTGWVSAAALQMDGDLEALRVVTASNAYFAPMQAFYLETTATDRCSEVPDSGVLVQTPEGVAEISVWINEVKISLGSTAYVRAQPDGDLTVTMLEGHANIETFGVTQTAIAGTEVLVSLGADGLPDAVPEPPRALTPEEIANLPVTLLPREIPPVQPVTPPPASQAGGSEASQGGGNGNQNDPCPGNSCNAPGQTDCPGNSCNAPGQTDCPGNSCNAPGQGGSGNGNGNGQGGG